MKAVILGVIVASAVIGVLPAQATLWDLLIQAEIEGHIVDAGGDIVLAGNVVDHAGAAVSGAVVEVRLDSETVMISTDETGSFGHTFEDTDLPAGTHVVNIGAETASGKRGLAGITFEVKGSVETFTHTHRLLQTDEARKYLNSDQSDWEGNPIGMTLYNYYQDLHRRYVVELEAQQAIDEKNRLIQIQKDQEAEFRQNAIEEENPGAGTFNGVQRDIFVGRLDHNVRGTIEEQMNYTVNVFESAQEAMNRVLAEGGTRQEAREAYFAAAATSREMIENLGEPEPLNATAPANVTVTDTVEPEHLNVTVGGIPVQLSMNATVLYLNVNGTAAEFAINGTDIVPLG